MSYLIKFLHLQKAELQYEVTIRGEIPAGTVLELRRQVCKLTQIYPSHDIADSCLEFSEDVRGITESLKKVKSNLDNLASVPDEGLSNRTQSLINHLYHRIRRVEQPDLPESLSLWKTIKSQFDDYFAQFSKMSKSGSDISFVSKISLKKKTFEIFLNTYHNTFFKCLHVNKCGTTLLRSLSLNHTSLYTITMSSPPHILLFSLRVLVAWYWRRSRLGKSHARAMAAIFKGFRRHRQTSRQLTVLALHFATVTNNNGTKCTTVKSHFAMAVFILFLGP